MNQPYPTQASQIQTDRQHLHTLSIFHYIGGGLVVGLGSLFLLQVFLGVTLARSSNPATLIANTAPAPANATPTPTPTPTPAETAATPANADAQESPAATLSAKDRQEAAAELQPIVSHMIYLMAGAGVVVVLMGWLAGVLLILSGVGMARRRWRGFSLVMAGVCCLFIPFGTILGVFTFVVLLRPSVGWLYQNPGTTADALPPTLPGTV